MDNELMLKKLKKAGIPFEEGLHDDEFSKIEATLGFRFPSEIRAFLACGLPVGEKFFNWRDLSAANVQKFHDFFLSMENAFRFDLENNADDMRELLDGRFSEIEEPEKYAEAVLNCFRESVRLIPFYGHRCFFDGMDDMPIISYWQPVDCILYGENFEDYLETEFLEKTHSMKQIPEQMKDTGIWCHLIG